jgi:hypothetical protein
MLCSVNRVLGGEIRKKTEEKRNLLHEPLEAAEAPALALFHPVKKQQRH